MTEIETLQMLECIKQLLIRTAKLAFDEAAISGLCFDGAVEAAISAMKDKTLSEFYDCIPNQIRTCQPS